MFNLKDDEWKNARSIVSAAFTSGKLKEMLSTMEPCVDALIDHLDKVEKGDGTFDTNE